MADHLTAGGIYFDIPENQQRSHDELITSLADFFVHHRQKYELIGDILTGRDTIAFQYRVSPNDEINADADGLSGSYSGAEFMALSGDAAVEYGLIGTVLKQRGEGDAAGADGA